MFCVFVRKNRVSPTSEGSEAWQVLFDWCLGRVMGGLVGVRWFSKSFLGFVSSSMVFRFCLSFFLVLGTGDVLGGWLGVNF